MLGIINFAVESKLEAVSARVIVARGGGNQCNSAIL